MKRIKFVIDFKNLNKKDVSLVGGKNASLGEMFSKLSSDGINVPDGFAITAKAYWHFIKLNKAKKPLEEIFKNLNPDSIKSIEKTSQEATEIVLAGVFPKNMEKAIEKHYEKLCLKYGDDKLSVAVRSSATAEDGIKASFAGQHETYLNVMGPLNLKRAVKKCMASLFTARSIAYREEKGFNHLKIALSVGVQKMVHSETASSGVMFTLDTESGFRDVILINSIWGIGEMIVQGKITPDEFFVFKPTLLDTTVKKKYRPIIVKNLGRKNKKYIYSKQGGLKESKVPNTKQLIFSISDDEILQLAEWGCVIEKHYGLAQDIEWAKDGKTGELFIVQSRPETIHSVKNEEFFKEYKIKTDKKPILTGIAIGDKIGQGKAHIISNVSKLSEFKKGEVLVTKMTDPDWVPVMRLAKAIITEEGGKTAHAAIVSRELGVPAIVGVEGAMKKIKTGQQVTVDCTQGLNGRIFEGKVEFETTRHNLKNFETPYSTNKNKVKIMMNIGTPESAFVSSRLPNDGVGLARLEFIIADKIRIHPLALYGYSKLKDKKLKEKIAKLTVEHKDKREYFVKELAEGIGQIAAAFFPKPVIVRFSDFKTNEYKNLIGGELFENDESNPMLGFRGAVRYLDETFQPAFLMELDAIKRARDVFGLHNIKLMVPFCRTPEEGEDVLEVIRRSGLKKGRDNLEIYVMCEVPSNVELAEDFLKIFDGMSIGSNDLTQLTLGIDRDNAKIQHIADETNQAVENMISEVIKICKAKKKYCGICGQAPSDIPKFAEFLIEQGIESISLNPDSIIKTLSQLNKK